MLLHRRSLSSCMRCLNTCCCPSWRPCLLQGQSVQSAHEPLLQVHFSPDGNFLYTGARRDPEILCWDVRSPTQPLYRLQRSSEGTNQRIQFTIEPVGRHLATGGAQILHCLLPAVFASIACGSGLVLQEDTYP